MLNLENRKYIIFVEIHEDMLPYLSAELSKLVHIYSLFFSFFTSSSPSFSFFSFFFLYISETSEGSYMLSQSIWIAVTKYYRLGGLQTTEIITYSSGFWKSKIRASAEVVSNKGSLSGSQMVASCYVFTWWKKARDFSGFSLIRAPIQLLRNSPS